MVQQKQGSVGGAVQHKAEVSQPGDPAELEADQVAAQVVAGRSVSVGAQPSAAVHLKRGGAAAVAEPEEEDEAEQQEEEAHEAAEPEAAEEAAPVEEPANADPRIAAVEAEAQALAPEVVAELGPQLRNEPVAQAFQALMAPEAEAAAEALPQPEPAPEPPAPAAQPKSRWQRFKSAVGGAASAVGEAASSAGRSIKKAFTFSKAEKAKLGNDVKDTAKLGVSVGKVAVPVAKLGGQAVQGSANLAGQVATAVGSSGAASGAAQVASTAGQVASVAGHAALPAAALTAAVDARAAYSSGKKANQLNKSPTRRATAAIRGCARRPTTGAIKR